MKFEESLAAHPENLEGYVLRLVFLRHGQETANQFHGPHNDHTTWSNFLDRNEIRWENDWHAWTKEIEARWHSPWEPVHEAIRLGFIEEAMKAGAKLRALGIDPPNLEDLQRG